MSPQISVELTGDRVDTGSSLSLAVIASARLPRSLVREYATSVGSEYVTASSRALSRGGMSCARVYDRVLRLLAWDALLQLSEVRTLAVCAARLRSLGRIRRVRAEVVSMVVRTGSGGSYMRSSSPSSAKVSERVRGRYHCKRHSGHDRERVAW